MRMYRHTSFPSLCLKVRTAAHRVDAPNDFRERVDFWRSNCGLPAVVAHRMHKLRIWRNASEHDDKQRWMNEGPSGPEEAARFIGELDRSLSALCVR